MFRFTIRDMLWLTVVVAMGVGWWIERQNAYQLRVRIGEISSDLAVEIMNNRQYRSLLNLPSDERQTLGAGDSLKP